MQTSTPLVLKQDTEIGTGEKSRTLRQQLFQNNLTPSIKIENNQWDSYDGPCFVDFGGSISNPHESFFDDRKSDQGTPSDHHRLALPSKDGTNGLINCLKNWSISGIESDSEETTLKASEVENTDNIFGEAHLIPETKPVDNDSANKSTERRRSTIVHAFSFEMREKEKQEHKRARLQYKMASEKLSTDGFRAKQSPKFQTPLHVNNAMPVKAKKKTAKPASTVPRSNRDISNEVEAKSTARNHAQPQPHHELIRTNSGNREMEDVTGVPAPQAKKPSVNVDNQPKPQDVKSWKKKPFQVSHQKRTVTIPRSPKLLTAQRANAWKVCEERRLQREKDVLELEKKKIALKNQRERMEIAEMRKKTVHKALPVPRYPKVVKRPLADPLNPIFIKRRRKD